MLFVIGGRVICCQVRYINFAKLDRKSRLFNSHGHSFDSFLNNLSKFLAVQTKKNMKASYIFYRKTRTYTLYICTLLSVMCTESRTERKTRPLCLLGK